jgi:hypothetical protein
MDARKLYHDWILPLVIIAIAIIIILSLRQCKDSSPKLAIKPLEKSNDSLRILDQKAKVKIANYEKEIERISTNALILENKAQVSETKYYELKKLKNKPVYITNIADCNDTIRYIYKYSMLKDSLCNEAIIDKNENLQIQDTLIKIYKGEKRELLSMVDSKTAENKNLNSIIGIEKKEVSKQKLGKNFYKITTIGLLGLVLKMILFK